LGGSAVTTTLLVKSYIQYCTKAEFNVDSKAEY